ncbi:MAG: FxLYD domain-containing protein [Thermomicrobiales bacterium]|nr:FxLYD domain-containing protein [Thermomicrobiales bacterium]MCO5219222.1 FxLYD domain-containing protein [Thermomicrobiales bacterium]MCO5225059.1 FxLYD domain-containing protein [Thermomicrobiales bacterium]MCO5228111.1 FxLYD domain-containing protein [Thermomicrobiales bacterium]
MAGALFASESFHIDALLQIPDYVIPVTLEHGLEIRDYRIFPTDDIRRFIVEIHNATDQAVDTPSIGVILSHLPQDQDFGVAVATSPVLHPHTSGILIGVAPTALGSDDNWGIPEWIICDDLHTSRVAELPIQDLTIASEIVVMNEDLAQVNIQVTNNSEESIERVWLSGDVYDDHGRVCGSLVQIGRGPISPGETNEYYLYVVREWRYFGNPFVLVSSAAEVDVVVSIQARARYVSPACPRLAAW